MIDNENVHVECFFHGNAGSTITPGTYHPMLYQSGDGTWEPYTGGKPSPSPEYPQEIVSTDVTAVTVTGANNQSKTASITLTEPLRGMGDVRDRIMCRDGVWGIERYVALRELTEGIVYSNQGGQVTPNNIIDNRYVAIWTDNYKGIISKTAYADSRLTAGYCNIAGAGKVGEWNKASGGKENIYTINSNGNIFVTVPIGVLGIGVDVGIDEVNAAVKQYVADHDVYVMFERATPTWEPLPSAAQSALNALTTYTGTTHVTVTAGGPEPDVGLEYFGQPGDKVTVQDMCDSFSAPGFDDSGVVEEITSFQSFYDKFVSGMKIRDFFRNLKAGLKFVLHTGQLVNNGLCNEPGKYPLDAAYGRTLLEMIGNTANLPGGAADIVSAIVTQNSNLGAIYGLGTPIPSGANLNDYTNPGNYYSVNTANTATLSNLPDGVTSGFRLEVIANTGVGWNKQILYPNGNIQRIWIRQQGDGWTGWYSTLTNADIPDSDWIPCVLKSGITTASNNYGGKTKLSYRKIGEQIHIVGGVAVTNHTSSTVVASLPVAYRPETTHYWLSPLTGSRIARCIIGSGGDLVIEWIKNISDGSDYTGNVSWIDMSGTFFAK